MKYLNILLVLVLTFNIGNTFCQTDTCLLNTEIGISFPPVADQNQRDFAEIHLDSLGIKKIRFAEDWTLREPTQGNFNWGPLDQRITWAQDNNYEVLLTIQSRGPAWACSQQNGQSCVYSDNAYFKNYIDSLLLRYPNQIDKIQFGNEWQIEYWYVGNANEFIESNNTLYNSVQSHSPNTKVVLGGFTTMSLRFLAACNGYDIEFYDDDGNFYDSLYLANNCSDPLITATSNRIDSVLRYADYDMLDIHLYDDAELWPALYSNFTDTLSKPVIVSEFGGPNMNVEPYSESYQADRVYEYIRVLDSIGIPEIYFFKLVEGTANPAHSTSGLIADTSLLIKPAYNVIKSYIDCNSLGFEYQTSETLRFYPNPAENWISFEFNNPDLLNCEISIYNSGGQLVYHIDNFNNNYFYLSTKDFSPGLHFVSVKSNNETIGQGKIIIK